MKTEEAKQKICPMMSKSTSIGLNFIKCLANGCMLWDGNGKVGECKLGKTKVIYEGAIR
jgi:hypothetical protein